MFITLEPEQIYSKSRLLFWAHSLLNAKWKYQHTYTNKQTNIYCWLIWTNKSINTTPTTRIFIYSHSHASGLFVVLIAHCASRYLLISPVCKSNIKSHTNNGIGNKQFSFMWMRFNSIWYVNNNNNKNKFYFVPFECRNFKTGRKKSNGKK